MNWFTVLKMALCYLLYWWPMCPQIGEEADANVEFVQSFGRNSIPDSDLGEVLWNIRTNAAMNDLATFVELDTQGFDPGKPNLMLAGQAMELAEEHGIPIITQWEVAYAIYEIDLSWYLDHSSQIYTIWPDRDSSYFTTREVKRLSVEKMRELGLSHPLEIAHPAMKARAFLIIEKLGVVPITQSVSWRCWDDLLWQWDENSVQPWTRDFFHWKIREVQVRVHHVLHRYVW